MARLNLETLGGLSSIESLLASLGTAGAGGGSGTFDEHLLKARSAAEPLRQQQSGSPTPAPSSPPERTPPGSNSSAPPHGESSPGAGPSSGRQDFDPAGDSARSPDAPPQPEDAGAGAPAASDAPERDADRPGESHDEDSGADDAATAGSAAAASTKPAGAPDRKAEERAAEETEAKAAASSAAGKSKSDRNARAMAKQAAAARNAQSDQAAKKALGDQAPAAGDEGAKVSAEASLSATEAGTEAGKTEGANAEGQSSSGGASAPGQVEAGLAAANAESAGLFAAAGSKAAKRPRNSSANRADGPVQDAAGASRHSAQRTGSKTIEEPGPADASPDAATTAGKRITPPSPASDASTTAAQLSAAPADHNRPAGSVESGTSDTQPSASGPAKMEAGERGSRPEAASPTQPAPGTQQADRVRFVQRVARAFAAAADRGGSIRLRLHPPELGSLRLELTIHNGAMTARLEAETETARNLIVENLPALRQRLAEHDIRVERFDVDWSGQSAGNLPQQARDQQAWHPRPGEPGPASAGRSRPAASAPPDPKGVFRPGHGSQFDVVI